MWGRRSSSAQGSQGGMGRPYEGSATITAVWFWRPSETGRLPKAEESLPPQ